MTSSNFFSKDRSILIKELNDLLKAHFSLRMQLATQQLNNTAQLKKIRRDIARIKTIINIKVINDKCSSEKNT